MDRRGPRLVMEMGVVLVAAGLLLAPLVHQPLAALRDARRAGRRRQRLPRLHRPVAVPAQLVRAPAGPGDEPRLLRRRRGLDRPVALAADRHRAQRAGAPPAGRSACSCWWCWCRSICCVRRRPEDLGLRARRRPRLARSAPAGAAGERGRPGAGPRSTGRSPRAMRTARFWWIALGYLLRPLRLVRGAGAPDEVPGRDRLQPGARGLGAGLREPGGHPRPDRARPALGPHRARVGVDGRVRSASRSASSPCCCLRRVADPGAAVRDGGRRRACSATGSPRWSARSRPRSSRAGTTAAIFGTLMLAAIGGRRRRALADRRAARRHRQLRRWPSRSPSRAASFSALAIWLAAPRNVRAVAGRVHRVQ